MGLKKKIRLKKVREILEKNGVTFEQEKAFLHKGRLRKFDFYITNGLKCFVIECHWKYYHAQDYHERLVAYKL
jgi:hypothetical protein